MTTATPSNGGQAGDPASAAAPWRRCAPARGRAAFRRRAIASDCSWRSGVRNQESRSPAPRPASGSTACSPPASALSRSRLKALILDGKVTIGARTIRDPSYRVNAGDTVTVTLPPPEAAEPAGEAHPAQYRLRGRRDHRDRQARRPRRASGRRPRHRHAGQCADRPLRRQPVRHRRRQAARHRAPARQGHHRPDGGGQDRPRPPGAAAQFADHGRNGPLKRGYLAFVWGAPDRPKGTIDAPIDRHPHARDKMAVREGGREAITHWQVLERYRRADGKPVASLLACRLETGRTHQIRVHLAHIGHPLLGDASLRPRLQDQGGPARPPRPASRLGGSWKTGPACLSTGYRTSRLPGNRWSSARNCRAILRRLRDALAAENRAGGRQRSE